ncbi:NTE family protein [Inhella inkyongensis]|uniref:NTE family protein n=1 Tax=Inhella inkyongensis TaxID=392593 RepID=A0A840S5M7_9BURK|nr:patatin-like phospholipase family protein [Inhella inkyongensis]MBB5204114.1 NTE family protein [Inhella inkyongensis]
MSAPKPPTTGLILTGGGARAAYQVGVLQAIAQIRRDCGVGGNPFDVIAGTSAGAINAATLACEADKFDQAIDGLVEIWSRIHVDQVYHSDTFGVIRTGTRWMTMMSLGWAVNRWRRTRPRSLLDNEPLYHLLRRRVRFERLPKLFEEGHLQALAVTGSSYTSGQHVTFYESAKPVEPWLRSQRIAVQSELTLEHLLASSAIPFIFPPQLLPLQGQDEWFGDGSMRQNAPISPAVHLGAERVLIIGAGRMQQPGTTEERHVQVHTGQPSMAQIAGHALSNIFLDALAVDIERLQRINKTLSLLSPEARANTPLRPLDVLVISPSKRLDDLAGLHQHELPLPIRTLLGAVGVQGQGTAARGSALVSYLLFEPGYTTELIVLGMTDTLQRRAEVQAFFGWPDRAPEPVWRRLEREGYLRPGAVDSAEAAEAEEAKDADSDSDPEPVMPDAPAWGTALPAG